MEKDNPTSFTDPSAGFTFIFDNPSPNSVNEGDRLAVYTNVQDGGGYYNSDAESSLSPFLDPGRWISGANWPSDSDSSAHHSPSGDDFSFDFRMSPSVTPLDSPLSPTSTTPEHQHQQRQRSMTFPNSEAYGGFPESQAITDALLRLSVQDPRDACLAPYLPESAVVGPSRVFEPEVDQPTFGLIDEVARGSTLELEWILGEHAAPSRRFDASGGGVVSLSEIEGGRTRGRDSDAITKRRKMDASFKCPHCQVDFTTRIRLNGHIDSTHHGKRYQCTEQNCGKSYRHLTSRDRHIENRHGKKR